MAEGEGDDRVTNTYQLIGKFLALRGPAKGQDHEVWYTSGMVNKNAGGRYPFFFHGVRAPINSNNINIFERVVLLVPGTYRSTYSRSCHSRGETFCFVTVTAVGSFFLGGGGAELKLCC